MSEVFYLPKNTTCASYFSDNSMRTLPQKIRRVPYNQSDFILCYVVHRKIYTTKFEQRSITYQSNSEAGIVK